METLMAPVVSHPNRPAARIAIAALALLWLAPLPGHSQTPPASATPAPSAAPATPAPSAPAAPSAPSPPAATTPATPGASTPPATPAAPAAQAPATSPPAAQAPATPPPAAQAPSTQPPAAQAPSTQPPAAQAPTSPATPPNTQAADPFGEELTLTAKTVVFMKGSADWDSAFETITDSLKKLGAYLDKQNIKPSGPPLIVYTSTDDNGFTYQAEFPVNEPPKSTPKDISVGKSPEGKALKFVHRGSYDNMDNTYEAITNHLDDKKLEAKDMFIEEYMTDPLKTAEDKLVINVFVPLK
jgi:effector-binding domain-containing protein